MTTDEIDTHIGMTAAALRAVVAQGVDRVLANHVMMGPCHRKARVGWHRCPIRRQDSWERDRVHPRAPSSTHAHAVEGLGGAQKISWVRSTCAIACWRFSSLSPPLRLRDRIRVVPSGHGPRPLPAGGRSRGIGGSVSDRGSENDLEQRVWSPRPHGTGCKRG